jgi:hypothetical protein
MPHGDVVRKEVTGTVATLSPLLRSSKEFSTLHRDQMCKAKAGMIYIVPMQALSLVVWLWGSATMS